MMDTSERRLILDRPFERAMETVLDAFLSQGFSVRPVDAGDLHQHERPGGPLRYAMLEATLPELAFRGFPADTPALLVCRLSLFELTGSCTLLTAENPVTRYPLLASMAPRLADRVSSALRVVIRAGVLTAA
jgi:hypothetical protein